MKTTFKALVTGVVMTLGTSATAAECIAPANPGGGWDFTCRQIGKILFDIGEVDSRVQVTNMAGAGRVLGNNHPSGAERLWWRNGRSGAFRRCNRC